MKQQATTAGRPGFTLVELLVVITIIAVLAAMGFAGANAAINKAKKTQALNVCTSLTQSLISFYDEYGALPEVASDSTTDTGDGVKLLTILMGYEPSTDANAQNPKQIRFYQGKEGKGKKGGLEYSGNTVKALWDPWGKPYRIRLDNEAGEKGYDEQIDDPLDSGKIVRGQRALVYSWGKNDKSDRGKGDDVKSW